MPNHCSNTLEVRGPEKNLTKFIKDNQQSTIPSLVVRSDYTDDDSVQLTLEYLLPTPKTGDWFIWRLKHWGTKWDVYDVEVVFKTKSRIVYIFTTAWAPPISWLEIAVKTYKKLTFRIDYSEPGNNFSGHAAGGPTIPFYDSCGTYH